MPRDTSAADPRQGIFGFLRAEVSMLPDNSFLIRPGRPVLKMTPAEFGREVGLSPESIYRRIADGSIPQDTVEYSGPRKILIHSSAIDRFRAHWKQRRAEA